MLEVNEKGLLNADLNRSLNLFLGAGFSTLACNSFGKYLPTGDQLKELILDEFNKQSFASLDLPSLYALLVTDKRQELRTFLENIFTVKTYNPKYDALRNLSIDYLYTTNIDDLPFRIFDPRPNEAGRVLHDIYLYGVPRQPISVIQYIALHGSVRHEDADFLFTSGQKSAAFASDRETWYVFQRELRSRPTLFVGYGMRDAGVLQALHNSPRNQEFNRWILLRSNDEGAVNFYQALGFHILIGDVEDFLNYIAANSVTPNSGSTRTLVRLTGEVPSATQIAHRPISYFFGGAEPEWSDAYSNQVVRRRTNSAVKNSLYTGKHVALVGLPLSGKTTILKQVAAEVSSERTVLYFDCVTSPQAEMIISENSSIHTRPLIFIDNLIDSRDAIKNLVTKINAQIICAEQSHYFDSVSLHYLSGNLDVHSTSEISAQDLQKIIDSIPSNIRRHRMDSINEVETDMGEVGLFESFLRHVYDENLINRFRTKLAEFEAKDQDAFDVYLMACYVAACRTLVSFNMIYMFINLSNKQYKEVYRLTERINSFLMEVDLPDDSTQDYFSVRSGALARIALRECQQGAFGRVYDRFHKAVPPGVIVDFPTFKRYAYDNDHAKRAYPNVNEGRQFYERLVRSTDSAYIYQHGAIYFSKMRSFKEAFSWIESAVSKTNGKVYSIRNSHARILFEANIDVVKTNPKNTTAVESLRESMDVLKTCIENDSRRSYHLLRFSNQALQYAQVIQDSEARGWLAHAHDRLKEKVTQSAVSRSRESYNRHVYQDLFSKVRSALISVGFDLHNDETINSN